MHNTQRNIVGPLPDNLALVVMCLVFDKLKNVMPKQVPKVADVPKKVTVDMLLPKVKDINSVPLGINMVTAQSEFYDFSQKITLLSSMNPQGITKFMNQLCVMLNKCENNNLIILNSSKNVKLQLDEKVKYYDSGFDSIVNVLYQNCEKANKTKSDKTFTIIIIGYNAINQHLKKNKKKASKGYDLDDLVSVSKNDSIKFLIYDRDESYEKLLNSDISYELDNSNGIWINTEFDSQNAFIAQTDIYDGISVPDTNDTVVVVEDSIPKYIKGPIR